MEQKPIIATTLSGFLINSKPWKEAHIKWFEWAANELKDDKIKRYSAEKNYFRYVDKVMKGLFPSLKDKERTVKARELFFDFVYRGVEEDKGLVNEDVVSFLKKLKKKYRIALITTNTSELVHKILDFNDLRYIFDVIETSMPDEKDDKEIVFKRFIMMYGKPVLYIGGDRKDSFDFCKKEGIECVFANFEGKDEILGVKSRPNVKEIEKFTQNL